VLNLATVTAVSPPMLIAFRVATGMALGGLFPSAVALTAEYFPERYRASLVTIMYVGIPAGFILAGSTAWALTARFGWRSGMGVAGVVPLLLAAVEAVVGCESLHFLLTRVTNGAQRAARILSRMIGSPVHHDVLSSSSTMRRSVSVGELFGSRRAVGTVALWAALSLIAVLLFTSGHMFNQIRKVPYVAGDDKGGISYFAGGFSNQFGMETQIIAAICEYIAFHQICAI